MLTNTLKVKLESNIYGVTEAFPLDPILMTT